MLVLQQYACALFCMEDSTVVLHEEGLPVLPHKLKHLAGCRCLYHSAFPTLYSPCLQNPHRLRDAEAFDAKHYVVCNAETWDANVFCQERNQLFKLSGYLHDQVELTETGRSLTETTSRASHSPRARPAAARAAATRNHQQAARPEPHANHVNHRAPPANPRRDNVQVHP